MYLLLRSKFGVELEVAWSLQEELVLWFSQEILILSLSSLPFLPKVQEQHVACHESFSRMQLCTPKNQFKDVCYVLLHPIQMVADKDPYSVGPFSIQSAMNITRLQKCSLEMLIHAHSIGLHTYCPQCVSSSMNFKGKQLNIHHKGNPVKAYLILFRQSCDLFLINLHSLFTRQQ